MNESGGLRICTTTARRGCGCWKAIERVLNRQVNAANGIRPCLRKRRGMKEVVVTKLDGDGIETGSWCLY